jgi:tetratricopeptide (TPR) repeat protein
MERRFATALLIGIPLIAMMALSLDRGQIWHDQNLYWCDLLRKSPAQAGAQYAVGQLDLAQGRDRAALDRASYAIALGEEMLARTGGTSVEPGGQDEALKAQVAQSYVLRARSYGLLGEHAQAAEDCQAAIRLAPNLPSAHASLGLAYLSQNKFAPAAAEFLAATKLAPGNPAYFTCLAQADISLGEYEAAAQALRQALTIDPEYEPALQLLPQGVPRPPPSN